MANILLVDDNVDLIRLQSDYLRGEGHFVATAENGMIAMGQADLVAWDLVITDIIMPEKDGIEVIIEMRKRIPTVKIIAMSGGGRVSAKNYLELAGRLGADITLGKPFSGSDLMKAVNTLLAIAK
jgi:CheY-like chemotaxis protein